MRRWLSAIFVLVLLFVLSSIVRAQNNLQIQDLLVDIWPEYDRPEVLVIYRVVLSSQTKLPAQVSLRLPSQVGSTLNVAMKDVDGLLYNLAYTLIRDGDYQVIRFITPSAEVQVEYYDASIRRNGTVRTYDFHWPGDYQVSNFVVRVLQPANVTKMLMAPDMGAGRVGDDGFTYYSSVIGSVAADTAFKIHIEYDKPDDSLQATLPVEPVSSVSLNTPGRTTTTSQVLPWALSIIGVVLMICGGIWYWRTGRKMRAGTEHHHHDHDNEAEDTKPLTGKPGGVYCHRCGKRAIRGDVFCRACGARLRY